MLTNDWGKIRARSVFALASLCAVGILLFSLLSWSFRDFRIYGVLLEYPYDYPVYGKSVAEWENDLVDPNVSVRYQAAWTLARVLHEKRGRLSGEAGHALLMYACDLGKSEARAATPELIVALEEERAETRSLAAQILARFGEDAEEAIPYLIRAFEVEQSDIAATEIVSALGKIGPSATSATPTLLRELDKESNRLTSRSMVVTVLGRLKAEGAIPRLLDLAIADEDGFVRREACEALGQFPNHSKESVSVLQAAIGDKDPDVRKAALHSLAAFHVDAQGTAPAVARLFHDNNAYVREAAAFTLGTIEGDRRKAVVDLAPFLSDSSEEVRITAARSMLQCDASNSLAVLSLIDLLASSDKKVRMEAACAVLHYEPHQETALKTLAGLMEDHQQYGSACSQVLNISWNSFHEFKNQKYSPTFFLISQLRDKNATHGVAAAYGLGQGGALAKDALPILKEVFRGKDPFIANEAGLSMLKIDFVASQNEVIPALVTMLKSRDDRCRTIGPYTIRILGQFGSSARAVTPALKELAKNANDPLAREATEALKLIDRQYRRQESYETKKRRRKGGRRKGVGSLCAPCQGVDLQWV